MEAKQGGPWHGQKKPWFASIADHASHMVYNCLEFISIEGAPGRIESIETTVRFRKDTPPTTSPNTSDASPHLLLGQVLRRQQLRVQVGIAPVPSPSGRCFPASLVISRIARSGSPPGVLTVRFVTSYATQARDPAQGHFGQDP